MIPIVNVGDIPGWDDMNEEERKIAVKWLFGEE